DVSGLGADWAEQGPGGNAYLNAFLGFVNSVAAPLFVQLQNSDDQENSDNQQNPTAYLSGLPGDPSRIRIDYSYGTVNGGSSTDVTAVVGVSVLNIGNFG